MVIELADGILLQKMMKLLTFGKLLKNINQKDIRCNMSHIEGTKEDFVIKTAMQQRHSLKQ